MPPYIFPELHTGNGKTLNSATFFLTKSGRISLEASWRLKFEISRVSVSTNCNFFIYVNQVSHRNNQPFPLLSSWHGIKFGIFLSISLYRFLRISLGQNKLIFDTWVILEIISNLKITYFFSLNQMMSFVVSFCQGLSLNLISTRF